jgi:hypothetical protein
MTNEQITIIYNKLKDKVSSNVSELIETENVKIQLSSFEEQKNTNNPNVSSVDLGICEERLKAQARIECCICKSRDVYFNFDLLINQINLTHSLCKNCKNNLDERLKVDRKRSYQTQFKCIFCNYEHVYNMINFNKENYYYKKDKKNKCCSIF